MATELLFLTHIDGPTVREWNNSICRGFSASRCHRGSRPFSGERALNRGLGPSHYLAFERFILMEILAHRSYRNLGYDVYWRTKSGLEVDFVLGRAEVAIEVKGSSRVDPRGGVALARVPRGLRRHATRFAQFIALPHCTSSITICIV